MKRIKLIAHRGGYQESNKKENSKETIKYAVSKDYIDGVEFDVRITKDEKVILIHNASIKYHNKRYKVSSMNYDKLNEIYFNIHHTNLCTLEEILVMIPKQKYVFLEVKNIASKNEEKHLELIYRIIKKYPNKKIMIISFLYKYLKYFASKGYPTCFLLSRKSRFFELKTYFKTYLTLKLTMISIDKSMVHEKNSRRILKSNKLLGIYTIHNQDEITHLFHKVGIETIKEYQDKIYITTTNPKKIYERIQILNEEN